MLPASLEGLVFFTAKMKAMSQSFDNMRISHHTRTLPGRSSRGHGGNISNNSSLIQHNFGKKSLLLRIEKIFWGLFIDVVIFQAPCQVTEVQTQVGSVRQVETLPETWPTFLTAAAGRSVAQVPPPTVTSTLAVWQGRQQVEVEAVVMDSSSSPDSQWPTILR